MQIAIVENESGTVAVVVPLHFCGLNYEPAEPEYADLAWDAAVEDNLVAPEKRDKYSFKLMP